MNSGGRGGVLLCFAQLHSISCFVSRNTSYKANDCSFLQLQRIPFPFRMGDHFVLLVDRLITESSLEDAIESKYLLQHPKQTASHDNMDASYKIDVNTQSSVKKFVECRICHDEDVDSNMEAPCSCCGSLKYAHRKCVQRWCNEKGDTICEICQQQFKPDYTAPPALFHYGGIPMNFRGNWEISRRDLQNPRFIAMVTTDHEYMNNDFDDEYSPPSSRSLLCCRIVAITFIVLLVLRHMLPILISGAGEYSLTLFTLLMLRTIGILFPIYIMVRAFTAIQHRRHQQDSQISLATPDEENDLAYPSRFIQIQ